MTDAETRAVLLQDAEGGLYAVPVDVVTSYRLAESDATALRDEGAVHGYIMPAVFQVLGTVNLQTGPGASGAGGSQTAGFTITKKHDAGSTPLLR